MDGLYRCPYCNGYQTTGGFVHEVTCPNYPPGVGFSYELKIPSWIRDNLKELTEAKARVFELERQAADQENEIKYLTELLQDRSTSGDDWRVRVNLLKTRIQHLKDALSEYANPDNWTFTRSAFLKNKPTPMFIAEQALLDKWHIEKQLIDLGEEMGK